MYSRYHSQSPSSLRVPEHYSGIAFSGNRGEDPQPSHRIEAAKPTPLPPVPIPPSSPPPQTPPGILEKPIFHHAIGQEEVLLLGLISLLADDEKNADTVLLLFLLLLLG